jgi:hypothetical protein
MRELAYHQWPDPQQQSRLVRAPSLQSAIRLAEFAYRTGRVEGLAAEREPSIADRAFFQIGQPEGVPILPLMIKRKIDRSI